MKKVVIIAVAVIMVLGLTSISMAAGRAAGLGITSSVHDFSASWGGGDICAACHTPHAATDVNGLLWNHTLSTATYTMYTNALPNADLDGAVDTTPGGISKLCLSCHDGTVALDAFGGATGTAGTITGSFNLGSDLSVNHPISIVYDVADLELRLPGDVLQPGLGNSGNIEDVLDGDGKLQCSSCHDVHDSGESVAGTYLLRKTTAGSALCLACHDK